MAGITIRNMNVSFDKGRTQAIKNLNLSIPDGEFCVFLGPSGCGKTTAMNCIAGLLNPTAGEILFDGRVQTSVEKREFVKPQERNIAMVFQEYALYPNMTVRGNMSFALKTKRVPESEISGKVEKMAKMLSIEHLIDRRPAELSGGQRQRVALGRALVRDPQVFLLDEPLGNLDAKLRDQVRYELKKIQSSLGITTVYVTHDQTEAMTMADHIVLLRDGSIVQEGAPKDLYYHPRNMFVAGFIGTPQINIFKCDVKKSGDNLFFEANGFNISASSVIKEDIKNKAGKSVYIGVRPSDFRLAGPDESGGITGKIDNIETLGDAFLVYIDIGKQIVIAKFTDFQEKLGDTVSLIADFDRLHVFDAETQERLN
jgi:multiple sugar transport system ATP-binding protein